MIGTLIPDIYELVKRKDGWFSDGIAREFAGSISGTLQSSMAGEKGTPTLRLSQMGRRCPCALWHSIHKPECSEPLPPWAEIKYAYGHIIEALVIALAKAAGHEVTGEQDVVYVDGIAGHRDCVIDGCIVDVKSSSSYGFQKFKDGTLGQNDSFGYLDQLDGYLVGSALDPLVRVKDVAYLLAVDKTLGHMVLYRHELREQRIHDRIAECKRIVGLPEAPRCECDTKPIGKSGNIGLGTIAGYNSYKYCCNPSLRTFIYADGPQYLVHVEKRPNVTEVDKNGKVIWQP